MKRERVEVVPGFVDKAHDDALFGEPERLFLRRVASFPRRHKGRHAAQDLRAVAGCFDEVGLGRGRAVGVYSYVRRLHAGDSALVCRVDSALVA